MAIKPKGTDAPVAARKPRAVAPDKPPVPPAEEAQAEGAEQVEDQTSEQEDSDEFGWAATGDEARRRAEAERERVEKLREERQERGYWPRVHSLIPPGTMGQKGMINDRFQIDGIILDAKPALSLYLHTLKNPRNGRYDVYEPCASEFDNCPLCPPEGEREARYVMPLTILNISGYQVKSGLRMGEFVPCSKELVLVPAEQMQFFYELLDKQGSLRGTQLTFVRRNKNEPDMGVPSNPRLHDDEKLRQFLADNGMLKPKRTQPSAEHPEGEVIDEREDWLIHPFKYSEFIKKPSGADLRKRYTNGLANPIGSTEGQDGSQWGNSRFEPGRGGSGISAEIPDKLPF